MFSVSHLQLYEENSLTRCEAILAFITSSKIPSPKLNHSLQNWSHIFNIWRGCKGTKHTDYGAVRAAGVLLWQKKLSLPSSQDPRIVILAGGSSKVEEATDTLKGTSHGPAEARDTPSMTLLGRTGRAAVPHRFWS